MSAQLMMLTNVEITVSALMSNLDTLVHVMLDSYWRRMKELAPVIYKMRITITLYQ